MTVRHRRSPETIFKHVFLTVVFLGIIGILKTGYEASTYAQQSRLKRSLRETKDLECRLVHSSPTQCSFVQVNCPDEEAGLLSYLQLYFCTLAKAKPLAFVILAVWISVLFSTIGIAASDYLCLNLSTIAAVMGMSESLTGVTFLAFGNGSPDVFSTFAAFSSHSGSLAVGELMGAAGFITCVVAGSMAITKPFRVAKKAFVRDVALFAIAAGFSLNFLKDGSLRMWECIVMIGFYATYVIFVVLWHWYFDRRRRQKLAETAARLHQHIPNQQELDVPAYEDDEESRPAAEVTPLIRTTSAASIPNGYTPGTPAWVATNVDDVDDETRDQYLAALSSNMRISRPTRDRRNTMTPIRPSLIGALEFRSVLSALEKKSSNAQPIYMRRYSEDGRHPLAATTESQAAISHPELISDALQTSDGRRSPGSGSGRVRAVSANDATSLGIGRDLLELPNGTPETAIYSPNEAAKPVITASHVTGDSAEQTEFQPYKKYSQNLLLSPSVIPSGSSTPGSSTPASVMATRNGFLAPPGMGSHRPSYTDNDADTASGATSPGAISPLALVPKLQIPQTGHNIAQELALTESPSRLSSPHSRPPSIYLPPPSMSPESAHHLSLPENELPACQIKWWPYTILPAPEILLSTLFPGLYDWSEKRWPDKLLALCTAPSIFLLTITVPVVESSVDENGTADTATLLTPLPGTPGGGRSPLIPRHSIDFPDLHISSDGDADAIVQQIKTYEETGNLNSAPKEWNRWLNAVQVFTAPMFIVLVIWANKEDEKSPMLLFKLILGSLAFSLLGLAGLLIITDPHHEPKRKPILCFLGFLVAIAWISTIAGEVVGVLKTFGVILDISDAILGLTIFAVGNSLGDLVADITVAKLGYPMMALSACFGGPMLNILLGIGIGGLYQTIMKARHGRQKHPDRPVQYKPYELEINTTLLISGATLLITLVFLLIVVPLNRWRMDRKIGASLIAIWTGSTVVNVVLEITGVGQTE